MKINKALEERIKQFNKKIEISRKKASDYATDADILANFKVTAEIFKVLNKYGMCPDITTPEGIAMFYVMTKYLRITNLYNKNNEPMNESIDDSHIDLENYSELARECRMDKDEE